MKKITREEALAYHTGKRHGKLEVVATKPCLTQRDLSMAYTPGVAEPCLEIEKNPELALEYTNKGNLVAWSRTAPRSWVWATSVLWPASR